MIETVAAFSRYFAALLFGTAVAFSFADLPPAKKNRPVILGLVTLLFVLQLLCLQLFGMDVTVKLYPLLSHLPSVLLLVLLWKQSLLNSLAVVFLAFLCCQPPRWVGALAGGLFDSATMDHVGYIVTTFVTYWFLQKYAVNSVRHLIKRSARSCLLFGAMPALYYVFDCAATVYTDFLYRGERTAVQFMPFVASAFYFVFVLIYYGETQKQVELQIEKDRLDAQFRMAQTEFSSLRQLQQAAAHYRHDLRHHISLLQSLASEGKLEQIKDYLSAAQSDIDAITPVRYCENETVNLILSAFATRARQEEISLIIDAGLPETLTFSDTELCSLISNALENAITACKSIEDAGQRLIRFRLYDRNGKLCMDIRNRVEKPPVFRRELPVTDQPGHGLGVKSMICIVERHGGVYRFFAENGWFAFQASV